MQPHDFRTTCSNWNDSHEPSVVLHLKGGTTIQGIARNPSYNCEGDPQTLVWVTTWNGDVLVDILSIVAMELPRG